MRKHPVFLCTCRECLQKCVQHKDRFNSISNAHRASHWFENKPVRNYLVTPAADCLPFTCTFEFLQKKNPPIQALFSL